MHEYIHVVSYLKEVSATTMCISYTFMSPLSNSPSNINFYCDSAQVIVYAMDRTGERLRISPILIY